MLLVGGRRVGFTCIRLSRVSNIYLMIIKLFWSRTEFPEGERGVTRDALLGQN